MEDTIALLYHDIFEFPLKAFELTKWQPGKKMKLRIGRPKVEEFEGYFMLSGRRDCVQKRTDKEASSLKKLKTLARAKEILAKNRNVLMVAITGSLAMAAAGESSDIDLMIVTKKGKLWSTRLLVLLNLARHKIAARRAGDGAQEDKLCLNIWLDESYLAVESRNPYTAHELAQVVPVINKADIYEKLIAQNEWILDYWPNALTVKKHQFKAQDTRFDSIGFVLEKVAYALQLLYMSRKRTREVVMSNRAFFHPIDWGKKVETELAARGVVYD